MRNQSKIRVLYCVSRDQQEAEKIANALVNEGLAACVNILPSVTSIYRWNGTIERASEVAFLVKTTVSNGAKCMRRIEDLHSYEVPCILVLPICCGNEAFIKWVAQNA
jgi:periplasmic divalent cation tolerance protein